MPSDRIHAAPASYRADAAALLADAQRICLVAAPTFAEAQRAEFVSGLLREAGADPVGDEAGNVVCRFGPDGPAHLFAAHLDTVFGPDQPQEVTAQPGRLCAPGLGDNSVGVAAIVALARELVARPPAEPVVLAANTGEEGLGDLRGAKHLVATIECANFIAVEGMMQSEIRHGGIGSIRLRVSVEGPGGHSWGDRGAPSAIHGLIECTARLLSWARENGASAPQADRSINVGRIQGGTSINTIAATASLELDLRAEDPDALAQLAVAARGLLGDPPEGLHTTLETVGERSSGSIGSDHPLMQIARRVRADAGLEPATEGLSSTDANAAYGAGIPAITVGVTTGGNAHRLDEFIELAPLPRGWAALAGLVTALAG